MATFRNLAACLLLLAVLAAPAFSGCAPPWASGFLLALLLASGACLLAGDLFIPPTERTVTILSSRPMRWMALAGLATLLWASASCAYDFSAGSIGGRLPALALPNLLAAWAYAAAFLCALRWGRTGRRLRRFAWLLFFAGALYAAHLVALRWGWGPREIWGWPVDRTRPTGCYTNANRFSVLLALPLSCGLGLLAAQLLGAQPRHSRRARHRRNWVAAALVAGTVLIASAIAYSLSRLTNLSLCIGFALLFAAALWKIGRPRRSASRSAHSAGTVYGSKKAWPRRGILLLLAALLSGAAILVVSLTFSGRDLASRLEKSAPDLASRAKVWRVGLELLSEQPWLGWGLGSFETVLAPRQPLDLPDRWKSAHSDWLQTGIELGLPGLLGILAATCCWIALWWHSLTPGRPSPGFCIAAGGGLGIFVALATSAGDFPLREPATATLFFFLAGALAAYGQKCSPRSPGNLREMSPCFSPPVERGGRGGREVGVEEGRERPFFSPPVERGGRGGRAIGVGAWIAALLLTPLLLAGTFLAARSGWAAASSPGLGYAYGPPPRLEDAASYRRALEISPRDPALLFPYAQALLLKFRAAAGPEKLAVRSDLDTVLADMRTVNPRDYRAPWLEGLILLDAGKIERATELLDLAVEGAPSYAELRHQALRAHLDFGAGNRTLPWEERLPHLQKALVHMRVFLKAHPEYEDSFVASLQLTGAGAYEIVQLWTEEGSTAALSRARFWLNAGKPDLAAQELKAGAAEMEGSAWHAALRGRIAWVLGDSAGGLAAWTEALAALARNPDAQLEAWMAQAVGALPPEAVGQIVERIPAAAEVPAVALVVAWVLIREQRWTAADQFLKRHTELRPTAEGFQCWAELSLQLKDREGALAHAREAFERSVQSPAWRAWWEQFCTRAQPSKPAP